MTKHVRDMIALCLLLLLLVMILPLTQERAGSKAMDAPAPSRPLALPFNIAVPSELPTAAPDSSAPPLTSSSNSSTTTANPGLASTPVADPTPTAAPLPDAMNILLLGTDKDVAEDNSWHTDSIIVLAVRPREKKAGMLSIPRDLWVEIPEWGSSRINTADFLGEYLEYPGGGPALLRKTIQENLGISTQNYVRVNIEGLQGIIATLGYITIDVPIPVEDWFPDPDAPDGIRHTVVPTGTQVLDAQTALDYARSRHKSTDFRRAARQQQVLRAICERAFQLDLIPRAWQLWTALNNALETDLTWAQIMPLIRLAAQIDIGDVRSEVIDHTMVTGWRTPKGAQVLLPHRETIQEAWQSLLADPTPVP